MGRNYYDTLPVSFSDTPGELTRGELLGPHGRWREGQIPGWAFSAPQLLTIQTNWGIPIRSDLLGLYMPSPATLSISTCSKTGETVSEAPFGSKKVDKLVYGE